MPRLETRTVYQPSVATVAKHLRDPIARLRFLQSAAPLLSVDAAGRRTGWLRWAVSRNSWLGLTLLSVVATLLIVFVPMVTSTRAAALPALRSPVRPVTAPESPAPDVWLVEKGSAEETFSNGLRIDNRYAVRHVPRSYLAFPVDHPNRGVRRYEPAGIVFHTTESHQVPFEAGQNDAMRRIGESLLEFVQRNFAYHFVIDRFGRVYRVVAESDAADHAGHSLWADDRWLYINLNQSFLGISLEARTEPGLADSGASPAQVHSAAMLTQMLRSRYRIPAANCVTHAQVSVNPANMLVGYHTDWASGFPFERVGLPNNYAQALPAIWAFGFVAAAEFRSMTGERLAEGIDRAENAVRDSARAAGSTLPAYRGRLQKAYRQRLAATR